MQLTIERGIRLREDYAKLIAIRIVETYADARKGG